MRSGRVWATSVVLMAVVVAGCGSRVDDTSTGSPTTTRVAVPVGGSGPSTTTTAAAASSSTAAGPSSTTAPASSTTAAPAGDDLADFCAKTKLLNLADVTAFEAYDAGSAVKLVFTFDKIQKAAPPELVDAFKDMRPLVEELNQKVKSGEVHDRDSLKAWLQGLNVTNQAALEQWVRGQAKVVPFIKDHCS